MGKHMVSRHDPRPLAAWGLFVMALAVGGCSSTNPTQPAPVAPAKTLEHYEELVGTNWTGTGTYTSGDAQPSRVSVAFIWGGTCNIPGPFGCLQGYNSHGWGTVDDIRTRILGYNDLYTAGMFRRELYVGQPTLGTGRWDSSVLSADRQRLVIRSSDFAWGQRRGVTIELTRAPWPTDVDCPEFRNCGTY